MSSFKTVADESQHITNPRVRDYLHRKKLEEKRKVQQLAKNGTLESYKRDVMLCAGLYDKVYSPVRTQDFCNSEWDEETKRYRYYKQVPIEVTEEEFAEIEKYSAISKPI